jgi:tRNA-(ms[2]io[6]A)-hydroxylase
MLGLKVATDGAWAAVALRAPDAVLVDHAHCEMKAASHALSLAVRNAADLEIVRGLTDLAREEIEHFQQVVAILARRGVALGAPPVDVYAAELRRAVHGAPRTPEWSPLVDRFLTGALIEARSCERFKLLAEADGAPTELRGLWRDLLAAEARHHRTFVDFAVRTAGGDRARVGARLEVLAQLEGAIVIELARRRDDPLRAAIHG